LSRHSCEQEYEDDCQRNENSENRLQCAFPFAIERVFSMSVCAKRRFCNPISGHLWICNLDMKATSVHETFLSLNAILEGKPAMGDERNLP